MAVTITSTVRRQAQSHLDRGRRARRSPDQSTESATSQLDLLSITDSDALTPDPIDAARAQRALAAIRAGHGDQGVYESLVDAAMHLPPRDEEGNQ